MVVNAFSLILGCVLIALALLMMANRAGYVVFVVGPRTLVALAVLIGLLAIAFRLGS